MLAWPFVGSVLAGAVVLIPVGAGLLLVAIASAGPPSARPRRPLAPALIALNTSAIYLGQAAGASSGGWLIAHQGYAPLSYAGLAWLALALALSLWAGAAWRRGRP